MVAHGRGKPSVFGGEAIAMNSRNVVNSAVAALIFGAMTAVAQSSSAPAAASRPGSIHWVADSVPLGGPWTFDVDIVGGVLTGSADQQAGITGAFAIESGRVIGDSIFFVIHYAQGTADREITFSGKRNGAGATFTRQPRVISGAAGGAGLVGGVGSTTFTVRPARPGESLPTRPIRVAAAGGTSTGIVSAGVAGPRPAAAAGAIPARLAYKGFTIDVTAIASAPDRDAILARVRDQLDLVEALRVDSATHQFFRSVPMVMTPTTGSAAYGGGQVKVPMHSTPEYDHDHPILLHELLHGYHDLRVPNGFHNAEIQRLFEQARSGKQFPAGEYMLSNVAEYFAMMASVYLNGTAMRQPSTRDAIRTKQPEMYAWLVKAFGPL
jgi:hypothetical protein